MINNTAKYVKRNYSYDHNGIADFTLPLLKLSYFNSSHPVGIAGDNILFAFCSCYQFLIVLCETYIFTMQYAPFA